MGDPIVIIEYYNRVFFEFHSQYNKEYGSLEYPHNIRQRFWQFVPNGYYGLDEASELILSYYASVNSSLKSSIITNSIAYWLHFCRRLSPGPIGYNKSPATIGLTRSILEAAFQKYGQILPCNKIGFSDIVGVSKIFGGLLMAKDYEMERKLIESSPSQLVLTDFTYHDLDSFYRNEQLAYEIWKCGAVLRAIYKGSTLLVDNSHEEIFFDDRTEDLDFLLMNYDDRHGTGCCTATGIVYDELDEEGNKGITLVPTYNLSNTKAETINELFGKLYSFSFPDDFIFNFLWTPRNIKGFRIEHLPLEKAFNKTHKIDLDLVISIIISLAYRVFRIRHDTDGLQLLKYWQHSYEGPHNVDFIRKEIKHFLPYAQTILGIEKNEYSNEDINNCMNFLMLSEDKRELINLLYSGPHSIFLPFGKDRLFIDYAWLDRRLFNLFYDIKIDNWNFKGDLLEIAIGKDKSVLPNKECKALDGTSKQIDCAYNVDGHLVIFECKVVALSIAYDSGDPKAVAFRQKKVVEQGLGGVDDKAAWLSKNPAGTNYDIKGCRDILPIAVSPFVEFIPSKSKRYWINDTIPRVLSINEAKDLLNNKDIIVNSYNRVTLQSS
jgi:hypothetical protein